MAGLSGDDIKQLHVACANLKRAMEDVRVLVATTQTNHNEIVILQQKVLVQEELILQLLDDKQSMFRWAMGMLGLFVVAASFVALGIEIRT